MVSKLKSLNFEKLENWFLKCEEEFINSFDNHHNLNLVLGNFNEIVFYDNNLKRYVESDNGYKILSLECLKEIYMAQYEYVGSLIDERKLIQGIIHPPTYSLLSQI